MDIIIFGGQSNMQGQTECVPENNAPVKGALEYKFCTNELVALRHPVGEDLRGEKWCAAAHLGHGGLVPAFCKEYILQTGREVIAIHAAKGNTVLGDWLHGTQYAYHARRKIENGIKKAKEKGEIEHIYYVWLQGESDAVIGTTKNEYIERITEYKNRLRLDCGIEKFCIIKVGYFCAVNKWYERTLNSHEHGKKCDEVIMAAQQKLPSVDSDFVMLTDIAPRLSLLEDYQNLEALGHYNNEGYRLIGEAAGVALAGIAKG